MVQIVSRNTIDDQPDGSDVQDAHMQVRESIGHLMDRFVFGDWQKISLQDLQQAAANIRAIKIRYLVSGGHEAASSVSLSTLNELYLQLCLALDTLAGKDPKQQEQLYRAVLTLETPLLSTQALLPQASVFSPTSVSSPATTQGVPPMRVIVRGSADDKEKQNPTQPPSLQPSLQPIRPAGLRPRFTWTSETEAHLKRSYEQGSYPTVEKAAHELSNSLGYPLTAVRNKLYQLTGTPKSQKRNTKKEQTEEKRVKEGD